MSNLIKNEFSKIFHKKAIYIICIIMFLIIGVNDYFMNKYSEEEMPKSYITENLEYMQEYLKTLSPDNPNQKEEYIITQTQIDLLSLQTKYDTNSWQFNVIDSELYDYVYNLNMHKYATEKNEEAINQAQQEYDKIVEKLDADDWKYFANDKLKIAQEELKALQEQKANTQDTVQIKELDSQIKAAENNVEILKLRIDNDISYANSYKNTAINNYQKALLFLADYDTEKEHTYEEQKEYNNYLEQREINKYIIETGTDVYANNTLSYAIKSLYSSGGGFIIFAVLVGIVIAGTIVSDEFSKGTIKMLLIRPYSRTKILASKYIVSLLMILFIMIAMLIGQLLIGGIIFGFDTLNNPVIIYNFETQQIQNVGVFAYAAMQAVAVLPSCILITTLAFAINTLTNNAPLSIGLPLIGYMNYEVINQLIQMAIEAKKFEFVKYFVTEHWTFENFLFGGLPGIQGFTVATSLLICAIYLVIMLIPTFIYFKKENIKNI